MLLHFLVLRSIFLNIVFSAVSIPSDPKGKSFFLEEAQHLVHDGLEEKIFTTFLLLVSSKHPEFMVWTAQDFLNLGHAWYLILACLDCCSPEIGIQYYHDSNAILDIWMFVLAFNDLKVVLLVYSCFEFKRLL